MEKNLIHLFLLSCTTMAYQGYVGQGDLVLTDLPQEMWPPWNTTIQRIHTIQDTLARQDVIIQIKKYMSEVKMSQMFVLVNCSVAMEKTWASRGMDCMCYTEVPLGTIYKCPYMTELMSIDMTIAITTQGSWEEAIVFTDQFEIWDSRIRMDTFLLYDCGVISKDMRDVLEAYYQHGDYVNIIVNCEYNSGIDIIRKIQASKIETHLKFQQINWLLMVPVYTECPATRQTKLPANLIALGDNIVTVYPVSKSCARNLTLVERRSTDEITLGAGVTITRCMMRCMLSHKAVSLGTYDSVDDILNRKQTILPANFQQFYRQRLIVAAGSYRPFYIRKGKAGVEPELIRALAKLFNFRVRYVRPVDKNWGSQLDNGSWNGMVGMVKRGEADLCIGGITVSESRQSAIDFTTPHHQETNAVLLNLPWQRWNYFYQVFHPWMWLSLSCLPTFAAILLWVWQYLDTGFTPNKRGSFRDLMFSCYGIATYQGIEISVYSWSSRLILFAYYMTIVIALATYTGNLTASLAVKRVALPFTTIRELANSNEYLMAIKQGSVRETLFRTAAEGTVYNTLWNKIQANPERSYVAGSKDAVTKMLVDPLIAYSADYTAIRYRMIKSAKCSLVLLPETYFVSGFGIGMRKGSPFKRHFDKVIHDIMELGLTKYWYKKHEIADVCEHATTSASGTAITIEDSFWVFVLLGAGLFISFVILSAECITTVVTKYQLTRSKQRKLREIFLWT